MIQSPNEPFDVSRLAFAIAHPSMTRRLLFSLLEHESWQVREEFGTSLEKGYGRPSPRRWNGTDFYVALTGAVLADDWAQDQIDGLAQHRAASTSADQAPCESRVDSGQGGAITDCDGGLKG